MLPCSLTLQASVKPSPTPDCTVHALHAKQCCAESVTAPSTLASTGPSKSLALASRLAAKAKPHRALAPDATDSTPIGPRESQPAASAVQAPTAAAMSARRILQDLAKKRLRPAQLQSQAPVQRPKDVPVSDPKPSLKQLPSSDAAASQVSPLASQAPEAACPPPQNPV